MTTNLSIVIQPIEEDGFHIISTITINHQPAVVIIDTGASKSVFDENRIEKFVNHHDFKKQDKLSSGLGTNTMESKSVHIDALQLNDLEIKGYNATLLNLEHVNASYQKLDLLPIDGIIGGDILTAHHAVIDYRKKTITLTK